jgi:DNA helicase-2/ATP-dependent DNA helicase PcrA
MDLLQGLNEPQRMAVMHNSGPLLIFAGAGSGKTRTLTHRIAYLIQQEGVSPNRILAVTFTNKAAKEMRSRLEDIIGPTAKRMWLGTFHALCAQMLRIHGERIGLNPRFVIFDYDDQLRLMKELVKDANLDTQRFAPARMLGRISDAKNDLKTPEDVSSTATRPHERIWSTLYTNYQRRLREQSALDFDDLLVEAVRLLKTDAESREHWSERFQHVLIDEFQDVNEAQFQWARMIASKHRNICVVGDDDQSIYAWRGANVKIILDFEKTFPDATTVRLEQNYRSTQNILDAAYGVIANNVGRADKRLWSENKGGEQLVLHGALNAQEEALWVVRKIEMLQREEQLQLKDFAILCRVNAQSRPFEEAFMRSRVPLKLVGTQRFYDRKEIRDVLAYLKFIYNPDDNISATRLINVPPRGIGAATVQKLENLAIEQRRSLGAVLLDPETQKNLTPAVARKVEPLQRLLLQLFSEVNTVKTLADVFERVLERTQLLDYLASERDGESVDRVANVEELVRAAEYFDLRMAEDLDEAGETNEWWDETDPLRIGLFLGETALEGSTDKNADSDDAVTLMTLHAAKGLEFKVVFLVGMEQGLLPHARAVFGDSADEAELEEERRLMYVGLTRGEKRIYLTHAEQRTMHGRTENTIPSQFLDEIPAYLLKREGLAASGSRLMQQNNSWGGYGSSRSSFNDLPRPSSPASSGSSYSSSSSRKASEAPPTFKIGDRVSHGTYGEGLVIASSTQGGAGEWAEVAFLGEGIGKKKLIVAYANLSKIA